MTNQDEDKAEHEEEQDWLPQESKKRARQRPDYQQNTVECEACQ